MGVGGNRLRVGSGLGLCTVRTTRYSRWHHRMNHMRVIHPKDIMSLDLDAIRDRTHRAHVGPWQLDGNNNVIARHHTRGIAWTVAQSVDPYDAEFLAHSREDVLNLLNRVRELETAINAIGEVIDDPEGWGWSDQDGMLESIGNTVEATGRKVIWE